jgi:tRNA (guanosine-2'-O-)-methyltransferase
VLTEKRLKRFETVLQNRQVDLTAVFENIWDPHNLSACLRSCDAVGILKVYFVYDGSQRFPKLGDSSSASARKWVESELFTDVEECYKKLRSQDFKIYTTHLASDSKSLYDLNLTEKVALVFGNEHFGITERACELADGNFIIPQVGMIKSLNISVACAISMYEAYRQRQVSGFYDKSRLSQEFYDSKLHEWKLRR